MYFTRLRFAVRHVRVNFCYEISVLYSRQLVKCNIYVPVVRVYADGRSTYIPVLELVVRNLVRISKLLRLTVRSHVSAVPTMHESRHCIDP